MADEYDPMEQFADQLATQRAAVPAAPPPGAYPGYPGYGAPMMPQAPQQPPMRQVPDGSFIGVGFALQWDGYQGDPNARVVLVHQSGQVYFDGTYGQLSQMQIPGVWIPAAAIYGAPPPPPPPVYANDGMGAAPAAPTSTGRKVVGGLLALAAAGGAVYSGYKIVEKMKE